MNIKRKVRKIKHLVIRSIHITNFIIHQIFLHIMLGDIVNVMNSKDVD